MSLIDSKPYKDFIELGKLPTLETNITLETASIVKLTVALFILSVAIITVNKIVKSA